MTEVRWGIIGPGNLARHFADCLAEAPSARLMAVAGRNPDRLLRFANKYRLAETKRHNDVREICVDSDVDAPYIATPRCHPQIERMLEIIRAGEIGDIRHIRASFGFKARFDPAARIFDRALAGGAILDIDPYPVSFARLVAGVALGRAFSDPADIRAVGHVGQTGVDEEAHALLRFAGDITAQCSVSIRRRIDNDACVVGSRGSIRLPDPWLPGRSTGSSGAKLEINADGVTRVEHIGRRVYACPFSGRRQQR